MTEDPSAEVPPSGPPISGAPISVAIAVITYRRPEQLAALLASLQAQDLGDPARWQVRIVVVDNDPDRTAAPVLADVRGPYPITAGIEPEPGIPFARQTSVELCAGDDAVIFVDDDEVAPAGWLQRLLDTWLGTGADVVSGPVAGRLPADAPAWAQHSDVYTSVGRHRTGDRIDRAYTNNTLVSRAVLDAVTPAFHPAFRFTGSSDLHFFLRVHRAGFAIVWDNEAPITEIVPSSRVRLRWLARRAFRSGAGNTISRRLITPGWRSVLVCAGLGTARIGNGLVLLVIGLVDPRSRIKGLRRLVSGIGSWAGLIGVNYAEYRR